MEPRGARVLVVEDDDTIADVVTRYLLRDGHDVERVADGLSAIDRAAAAPPDLVILDLMLPGIGGLEVCRRLQVDSAVPVIMLTARTEEEDRIIGLEAGADDYVAKPFSPRELTARVRSVLRRTRAPAYGGEQDDPGTLRAGELEVDPQAREARRGGTKLELTSLEFDLLAFLMRHPRQALTRQQLLEGVWGSPYGEGSTVTVHISRLREKVEPDPQQPRWITTVWGVGYRFDP